MSSRRWFAGTPLLLALAGSACVNEDPNRVSWSALRDAVERDKVERVVFDRSEVRAYPPGQDQAPLRATRVTEDHGFIDLLESKGIEYRATAPSPWTSGMGLLVVGPLLLLLGLWALSSRANGGGASRGTAAFGRSQARLAPEAGTGVSFADVAGVDEAAEELQEVVAYLRTPERFTTLGGRPPKGVLLVGPPGTGKTLLARAVAGEAGVPFFSISGSDFVEMFVGVGAARVRDLFKTAEESAPCIIFVDELDAVGRARGGGGPGGNEEREQTLNQLLVEMDGFDNRGGIIVMAATNRPEILDQALLRPGRFDRQVLVDRPDLRGRLAILQVHAKKIALDEGVELEQIARHTPGFAGAELAAALNEAALLAARERATSVRLEHIHAAIERTVAGLEKKNRRLSDAEKEVVAYHECGHAICAAASPGADPVHKISIIPRGIAALGYTIQTPLEDRYLLSKSELLNRITVLYGGRAAEELIFGDVTTGAGDDIRKATDTARRMVAEYGMSRRIGAVNYCPDRATAWGSPQDPIRPGLVEREVRKIIEQCHRRSFEILHQNRLLLEEMSLSLLEHEVLDGDAMRTFLDQVTPAGSLEDLPTGEWIPAEIE
ncbi:MAG: ATP-dependent zinc metalloprotease FtsH [Deltaproteobacteria bacterium]|nr:ATP-dependent zinc metalloprotease FtsH [Deltaproteobacteria bacterium]